jgi:predicted HD phosphohydrolase
VAHSGRTVDWLHLAGPRYLRSEDDDFFRPLSDSTPATRGSSSASCCELTACRA